MKTIENLLKIKSLVTLSLTSAFVYLSINGTFSSVEFMTVFTMVIGFYFGTQKLDEFETEEKDDEENE